MNASRRWVGAALGALVVAVAAPPAAADAAARLFHETCAGCHTIGGGDLDGPDLAPATGYPRAELEEAVRRMEEYAGTLDDQQVAQMVALLQDPEVARRLARGEQDAHAEERLASADPAAGGRLFFGEAPLAAAGMGCFACHAIGGRGGTLASDLTTAWEKRGAAAVLATTEKPTFPLMRVVYARRPVTAAEAADLAAFLRDAAAAAPQQAAAPAVGAGEVAGPLAAAFALLAVAVGLTAALVSRGRGRGARERLAPAPVRR